MAVANYIEELRLGPEADRGGRQARGLGGPEAARLPRPRRHACAVGVTPGRATPPPSRTTTTCRTTSTGWCSGRRSRTRARCGTTTPPRSRTRRRTSTSSSAASSPSQPGMRLLDVGCGWGGMLLHAAEHHGVQAVGVTLSRPQAELARKRAAERGLGDRVEVRFADFRDVDDGPYDAISSIGMFEHVGLSELDRVLHARCHALLRPEGRLLNHGISRPHHAGKMHHHRWAPSMHGSQLHRALRVPRRRAARDRQRRVRDPTRRLRGPARGEPARALRARRCAAGSATSRRTGTTRSPRSGAGRARVWRLYMAAAAVGFEHDDNQVHQVLATATTDGASGMPLPARVHLSAAAR